MQISEIWRCLNLRTEEIEALVATNLTWKDFHLMNMMSLVIGKNHKLICRQYKNTLIIKVHKIMKLKFN